MPTKWPVFSTVRAAQRAEREATTRRAVELEVDEIEVRRAEGKPIVVFPVIA
jgi:hypothetical protein